MSGGYLWVAGMLLGLGVVVIRPVRTRVFPGRSRDDRADDPLIEWVATLRSVGEPTQSCVVPPLADLRPATTRPTSPNSTAGSHPPGRGDARRPIRGGLTTTPPPVTRPGVTPLVATAGAKQRPLDAPTIPEDGSAPTLDATPAPHRASERQEHRARHLPNARLAGMPHARALLLIMLLGATVGGLLGGPVAAVALAGYGAVGVRALLRGRATARAAQAQRERLDQLCALAADLRAGLPVPVAVAALRSSGPDQVGVAAGRATSRDDGTRAADSGAGSRATRGTDVLDDRPRRLAEAAVRLADRTGAPLAELVERIEADARSTDRGLGAAAAQAAGARATAWLLAALPVGGIALGYGIGVDPLQVLLRTPIGGACAVAAVVLQAVGLLWADRLGATPAGAG
ncbi:type II secretion system F family protein [Micromonospora sp. NPDC049903]|uniref:type II secretion system F family protein n=1 Tax=Micromonospora sp. NPDC049903 TaxID=3364276 RepID=UPI0037A51BB0